MAQDATIESKKQLNCAAIQPGRIRCLVTGYNSHPIQDGDVASVVFTAAPAAKKTSSTVTVSETIGSHPSGDKGSVLGDSTTISVVPNLVSLADLTCSPASVVVGGASTCIVRLSSPASSGAVTVNLGSAANSSVDLQIPKSITVPSGAAQASFQVRVKSAKTTTPVVITASANGTSESFQLIARVNQTVHVEVSPAAAQAKAGQKIQFHASVTGTHNTSVTWSLSSSAGSISSTGLYTAPAHIANQTTVRVMATSVADKSKNDSATITLLPNTNPPPPGSISLRGISCAPSLVKSNQTANCSVTLTRPAPGSGVAVRLTTVNSPAIQITLPNTVVVKSGSQTALFQLRAKSSLPSSAVVLVSATLNGKAEYAQLTITK
jgi:hypothetical protein